MSGVTTSSLSLAWSLRNWVILDYEEANGQMKRPWAPFLLLISSQFFIFFSLFSFILAWTFISLQIKEFRIMGLSINDSVYSCLFFFLTGLHFFHLLLGLLLCCLFFCNCSFLSLAGRVRRYLTSQQRTIWIILFPIFSLMSYRSSSKDKSISFKHFFVTFRILSS